MYFIYINLVFIIHKDFSLNYQATYINNYFPYSFSIFFTFLINLNFCFQIFNFNFLIILNIISSQNQVINPFELLKYFLFAFFHFYSNEN
jgi:hypothetical protein